MWVSVFIKIGCTGGSAKTDWSDGIFAPPKAVIHDSQESLLGSTIGQAVAIGLEELLRTVSFSAL